ncbi:MAG: SsrA-binding protein SmpB [Lachnospiraceae bacterium]|nr:SsrA-binding protein SmpB [Lachnospiraceae bacterium]
MSNTNGTEGGHKLLVNNKKAYFDYFIEDKLEVGIELFGTEVKSVRMGKCSIKEAYVDARNGELYIYGMNITPYEKGNIFNKDPIRERRLLAHKKEIMKLQGRLAQKGYTILPLEVYLKRGKVKLLIGLGRGKKLYDKRDSIAKKDLKREMERDFKIRNL